MKFTHTRLLVENYAACFRFYQGVMQLEAVWGDEEGSYADFRAEDGGSLLAINAREIMADIVGSPDSSSDNAVLIFHVDDLESAVQTLKERGATFVTEIQDRPSWGIRTAHLRDPAGNLLELNTPLFVMTLEELRAICLAELGAYEDFPFGPDTLVFKVAGKMLALCGVDNDPLSVNLKPNCCARSTTPWLSHEQAPLEYGGVRW